MNKVDFQLNRIVFSSRLDKKSALYHKNISVLVVLSFLSYIYFLFLNINKGQSFRLYFSVPVIVVWEWVWIAGGGAGTGYFRKHTLLTG